MTRPDYTRTYQDHLDALIRTHGRERAMELVVGDYYHEIGALEKAALIQLGLAPTHTLIDIGTGSGRLPYQLRDYLSGHFLGTDVLAELLDHAREKCGRPDWTFTAVTGPEIPAPDATADFVTFFSVFTHLLDEDIYRYLREARRVLKPSGFVVASFLDLENSVHWALFERTVAHHAPGQVLDRFITASTLQCFAHGLGFFSEAIHDGSKSWIPTSDSSTAALGQSVIVLRPFPEEAYLARHPDVKQAVAEGRVASGLQHYRNCGFREGRALN